MAIPPSAIPARPSRPGKRRRESGRGHGHFRTRPSLSVPIVANFLLFQAVWLITVFGASRDSTWAGIAALGFFLGAHLFLSRTALIDYALCALAVVVGVAVESIGIGWGLIAYRGVEPGAAFPPAWILVLWCNLGLILNNSIAWLLNRPILSATLGAIGGAASYIGGVEIGAADFGIAPRDAIPILALTWAVVTPMLMYAARRLNRL